MSVWIDIVGWVATGLFVGSYFCARPESLRRAQMLGAALWIAYGLLLGAPPVVAANVLVITAAAWTARSLRRAEPHGAVAPPPAEAGSSSPEPSV